MKAFKILRTTTLFTSSPKPNTTTIFRAFFSAEPLTPEPYSQPSDSTFDSSHYEIPISNDPPKPTWNENNRKRVEESLFGDEGDSEAVKLKFKKEEDERKRRALAKALLEAALNKEEDDDNDDEEADLGMVKEEDQKSLSVGIIGAPNAGKSALTNYMVGSKVAAVSRKTNTTTHEVVGVLTKGDTQICFFDTPGLMLNSGGIPYRDVKARVESAWSSVNLYEVLIVIFDVHRHITKPDSRVTRLIKRMGERSIPNQKRVLCINKIDLVQKKKDLLKVAAEFKDLPGYERHFMISGMKGAGVKDLTQFLMEQAVERPWDEDPFTMTEEVMKMISLEVVRERLLDHVHQEIPYEIEHRLVDWKELRDGSIRIEQHFVTNKLSQRRILIGKNGSKIGRIGIEANEELRTIFKKQVHLILQVRLK
ncbi:GTPase ERA, chloroplastic [Trifolium repens]|nr:GTPase ERA, chloroplastic [Trifolium repens]